ncbi:MAG TPA: sialate O-acetylesterase [Armatimonadota bacterium]|jgi:sialate O-acetylesterase
MKQLTLLMLLCALVPGWATVSVPSLFADHMVVQREKPIAVWGNAAAGERVTVTLAGAQAAATADRQGRWLVRLPALPAGGPHELTIQGTNTLKISDVLVGEVWVCSGQSNMQVGLSGSAKSIMDAPNQIRQFRVPPEISEEPFTDCKGQWMLANDARALPSFSAVGYYFARKLYQELQVPIGIVFTAYGGTIAEGWTSPKGLSQPLPGTLSFNAAVRVESDEATATKIANPKFDDSAWPTMALPGNWEKQGLPDFNGMVWYRKTIDIPAKYAGRDLQLSLGPIDEIDVTWFNGVKVGMTGELRSQITQYWYTPRNYIVPGFLVKPGKNVIAVRVIDTNGEGGFWSKTPYNMQLAPLNGKDEPLILDGPWRYQKGIEITCPPGLFLGKNAPSLLYNAMIAPLIPYTFRGAAWYQGESNASGSRDYARTLSALIKDWRKNWGAGDFPFIIVQLPSLMGANSWAELREAQAKATTLPQTWMTATYDIGEPDNLHPNNKPEVGRRLALIALNNVYARPFPCAGPTYQKMQVEGNRIRLYFTHTDGGLVAKDALRQFVIAGSDGHFLPATATVDGDTVVVTSEAVAKPAAVRYAWSDAPQGGNLYNGVGLPAPPFRTDNWPLHAQ